MKKIFVTMMMIMALTTAAVSAQTAKTVDRTAAVQIQTVKDALVEKAWSTIDEYQTIIWEKEASMTEEEVEHLTEEYLKVLPKCVNKNNIKWISKSELRRALAK